MKKILAIVVLIAGVLILATFFDFKKIELTKPTEVVELANGSAYELTANYVKKTIAGREQKMLAYNGSIPGPTIRVKQGSEITINFHNRTDLPALLHSHGVRMANTFDGAQNVQPEMKPGESFTYKLQFPDPGIYWYHPHAAEVYGQGLGLYGAFIVEPAEASYWPPADREMPLFLSDIPTDPTGKITLSPDDDTHILMGHFGNTFLVNGEEDFQLVAKAGEVVRLYMINAANARPFRLAIKDTKLKLIGGDGGAYERSMLVDNIILGPSERAVVDVQFAKAGNYDLLNQTPDGARVLGTVAVADGQNTAAGAAFSTLLANPYVAADIAKFQPYFNRPVDKTLRLSVQMAGGMMGGGMGHGAHMMPDGTTMNGGMMMAPSADGIEWEDTNQMMNQMSDTDSVQWQIIDQAIGKANMAIDWTLKKGEPVKIRIVNDKNSMHPMQHPIHFHGQRFLVLDKNGTKQTNLVWKDTVLVPAGEYVDILLDASNPGDWMAHCHISEHLVGGMMFGFKVE